jgi:hypothetical protein
MEVKNTWQGNQSSPWIYEAALKTLRIQRKKTNVGESSIK